MLRCLLKGSRKKRLWMFVVVHLVNGSIDVVLCRVFSARTRGWPCRSCAGFVSYVEVLGPARGHWVFRMQGSVTPRWVIDGHVQLMLDLWAYVNGTRYTLPLGTEEPYILDSAPGGGNDDPCQSFPTFCIFLCAFADLFAPLRGHRLHHCKIAKPHLRLRLVDICRY